MTKKKVLIFGSNGVVGFAALKNFTSQSNVEVVAISRKPPVESFGATFYSVDLLDNNRCQEILGQLEGVTHIVYCAVYEKNNLRQGWLDEDQITKNDQMLRNVMENLSVEKNPLKHITLLQGSKAYGTHVGELVIPARENRSERKDVPNFYWKQEDYIKEIQKENRWSYTILRPRIIFGEAIGSAMNIIPAIGVYASILKEMGEPLHYPGSQTKAILQAVDADLLAKGIEWAGESDKAKNEIFNITNGDIFVWYNIWPVIAKCFGMEVGDIKPIRLQEEMPKYKDKWDDIRTKYELLSPSMDQFVNTSFEYADWYLHADETKVPPIVSTVKIYQSDFTEAIDTEDMFIKWFNILKERRLLPS